jgi:hypothetical protein
MPGRDDIGFYLWFEREMRKAGNAAVGRVRRQAAKRGGRVALLAGTGDAIAKVAVGAPVRAAGVRLPDVQVELPAEVVKVKRARRSRGPRQLEAAPVPFGLLPPHVEETPAPRGVGRSDYSLKQAMRIERLEQRAAKKAAEAQAAFARDREIASFIPMGQPILVGHHSQRRHERDLERMNALTRKGIEAADEARRLERAARVAASNPSISSDDPEAVTLLRQKVAELEAAQARMVAANQAIRGRNPRAGLTELGFKPDQVEALLKADFAGRVGFPSYALSNNGAEIRRAKQRIEQLEKTAAAPARAPETFGAVRIEEADNRVRIYFPGKPAEPVRADLKMHGFRWSPSAGAWQRMAGEQSWYWARRLVEQHYPAAAPLDAPPPPAVVEAPPAPSSAEDAADDSMGAELVRTLSRELGRIYAPEQLTVRYLPPAVLVDYLPFKLKLTVRRQRDFGALAEGPVKVMVEQSSGPLGMFRPKTGTLEEIAGTIARFFKRLKKSAPGGKLRRAPSSRLAFAAPWDPEARNGRGGWREFIRATKGRSGAYVIRPDRGDPYVGSSAAGRLYRTLIRHFEEWGRDKEFWAKTHNRAEEAPGETFDRNHAQVAVVLCAPSAARALEAELMRRLRAKDEIRNQQAPQGHADEVPF